MQSSGAYCLCLTEQPSKREEVGQQDEDSRPWGGGHEAVIAKGALLVPCAEKIPNIG